MKLVIFLMKSLFVPCSEVMSFPLVLDHHVSSVLTDEPCYHSSPLTYFLLFFFSNSKMWQYQHDCKGVSFIIRECLEISRNLSGCPNSCHWNRYTDERLEDVWLRKIKRHLSEIHWTMEELKDKNHGKHQKKFQDGMK